MELTEEATTAHPMDLSGGSESDLELTSDEEEEAEEVEPGDLQVQCEKVAPGFPPEQTLFVFDWDDTLLPSTWLARHGLKLDGSVSPSPAQQKQLRRLARSVSRTLRGAKRCGTVVLVTNAERGWIELSCTRFMPSLCPVLEDLNLISARSAYEPLGVTSPLEWKSKAFADAIGAFFQPLAADQLKNVISLGDSVHERMALMQVTKQMTNCYNKSLKFMERPDAQQLLKEHELISRCIPYVASHDGNLDLRIQLTD